MSAKLTLIDPKKIIDIIIPDRVLIAVAKECIYYITRLMARTRKTGRTYKIPRTKVYYRASAPFQPPAVRTGVLLQSVAHSDVKKIGNVKRITIGSNVKYAKILEEGSDNIQERPAFVRALKDAEAQRNILKVLKQFYRRI